MALAYTNMSRITTISRQELARLFPRFDHRAAIMLSLVVIGATVMALMPRFAQPPAFHDFADRRAWLGVPNSLDVVSNAPFTIAAAMGLWFLFRRARAQRGRVVGASEPLLPIDRVCLTALFLGIGLTSIGSAYYHLAPGNERLVWDRLPMLLTFTCLLTTLIAERVSPQTAAWLMAPMLIAAASSVFYWRATELAGAGDLRPYFLVQGAALICVVLVVSLYPARYLPTRWLLLGLGCYATAIVFEQLDRAVWSMWTAADLQVISGHTIKHLCASAGAIVMAMTIKPRVTPRV